MNLAHTHENQNPARRSFIVPKHLPQNTSTIKYTTQTAYACLAKMRLPCTIRFRYLTTMGLLERQDL